MSGGHRTRTRPFGNSLSRRAWTPFPPYPPKRATLHAERAVRDDVLSRAGQCGMTYGAGDPNRTGILWLEATELTVSRHPHEHCRSPDFVPLA